MINFLLGLALGIPLGGAMMFAVHEYLDRALPEDKE
jgi:hypothetical protein